MNLRYLHSFMAVAERLSLTGAAKSLGIAQPSLTAQIRNLEAEVGGPLFFRQNRRITLTPLGSLLVEEARELLQRVDRVGSRLRDAVEGRDGHIRVSYTDGGFSDRVIKRVRKFLRKHRGVRFEGGRRSYADGLRFEKDCDALITEAFEPFVGATILDRTPLMVSLPPKHRLTEKLEIHPADLIGETLIVAPFSERSPAEQWLVRSLETQGIRVAVTEGSARLEDRQWAVAVGCGISVVPGFDTAAPETVEVPLHGAPTLLVQCLPNAASRAGGLAAFLEAIRE